MSKRGLEWLYDQHLKTYYYEATDIIHGICQFILFINKTSHWNLIINLNLVKMNNLISLYVSSYKHLDQNSSRIWETIETDDNNNW